MDVLRFVWVAVNAALFGLLLFLSLKYLRREPSPRIRRLWAVVGLTSGALLIGSSQRLILQSAELDWASASAAASAVRNWQPIQSLVVMSLTVFAFLNLRRIAASMSSAERVAGVIVDRVSHIDPSALNLSPREVEVLAEIGRGLVTDEELAYSLHISKSTVQTHIKSLLRKTSLNRRQDLLAVAILVESSN